MAKKGETVLMGADHPGTRLKIMNSPAGYYLGFEDDQGLPYSRESVYFKTYEMGEMVLGLFRDDEYRP